MIDDPYRPVRESLEEAVDAQSRLLASDSDAGALSAWNELAVALDRLSGAWADYRTYNS